MTYVSTCVTTDGALGFYILGEASSASAVADQSSHQNGTYGNTAGITLGQTGIVGGAGATACRFTAASAGYVFIADNATQHVGDTFSLECWIKLATTGVQYGLMSGNTNNGPTVRINTAGKIEVLSQGVALIGTSVAAITDTTTFHHVVWTKATTTNHIYIDGAVSDGSITNATIINSAGWYIGVESGSLNGTVQMAAIYPTALSATKVLDHYTQGTSSGITPTISGTPRVGQTLTASPAAQSAYRWSRADDGAGAGEVVIAGATAVTYVVQGADVGKYIRVAVSP